MVAVCSKINNHLRATEKRSDIKIALVISKLISINMENKEMQSVGQKRGYEINRENSINNANAVKKCYHYNYMTGHKTLF